MHETFDSDYPTVELEFLLELCKDDPRVEAMFDMGGETITILFKGSGATVKRAMTFSYEDESDVEFDRATALAIRLRKTEELNTWLKKNRDFNHG